MNTDVHALIDLETLAVPDQVPPGSPVEITEIGLVVFTLHGEGDGVLETGHWFPAPGNGAMDRSTVDWWMKQIRDGARPQWLGATTQSMEQVLQELRLALIQHEVGYVWGNDPEMDLSPLQDQFALHQMVTPWRYYERMDLRTVRNMAGADRVSGGHDALPDALEEVALLRRLVRNGKGVAA